MGYCTCIRKRGAKPTGRNSIVVKYTLRGQITSQSGKIFRTFRNSPQFGGDQTPAEPPSTRGAGGGTRTHTSLRKTDFKSVASTIPPRPPTLLSVHGRRRHRHTLGESCRTRPGRNSHPGSHTGLYPSRKMVRPRGLEPPRCYPLAPQASASTNSAMAARHLRKRAVLNRRPGFNQPPI